MTLRRCILRYKYPVLGIVLCTICLLVIASNPIQETLRCSSELNCKEICQKCKDLNGGASSLQDPQHINVSSDFW